MGDALRVAVVIASCIAAIASTKPPPPPPPPSPPEPHRVDKTATIPADLDTTWSAVIDVFSERDWAIDNMDKASGLITTDWMRMEPRLADIVADCGINNGSFRTMVRFNVRVKPQGEATSVTVNTAFRSVGGVVSPVDCTSRGGLEREIHRDLTKRVSKAPPATDAGVP